MTDTRDRYAVFGNPIRHSRSPLIHSLFAEQTGQDLSYTAQQAESGQFAQAVDTFLHDGGRGLNVTVPFKEDAWRYADSHSSRALRAGAVNTLVKQADGSVFGDTTDGIGLVKDLTQNHGVALRDRRLLIIGAGGAVRGVLEALLEHRPSSLVITNRTKQKAVSLADDFSDLGDISACGLDEIGERRFDVVINGTSASLHGELPPLPGTLFAEGACSYDMMYGAEQTPFMRWSANHGASVCLDGLGMLVEQAAESFFIWRGVHPDTSSVIAKVRQQLSAT